MPDTTEHRDNPPTASVGHPRGRVVVNVTPHITTSNANTQQTESILALIVGIAIGLASALAAMEKSRRR